MTAVICWSMKMRMVQSKAGSAATSSVHQGLSPSGSISQPRFFDVGFEEKAGMDGSLRAALTDTLRLLHGMESEPFPVMFHSCVTFHFCMSSSEALTGGEH
ncbi:hypothetical protein EYF80_029814 [Liparis tanakae]|uniref:Uncharacterized protein n=1 Tax=Liparis tanakae TaxID=230148 RepID=A0A4Z2H4X9_9TELE|nr:hypothetical protein EYF80_029814 [Liparis tanakae]